MSGFCDAILLRDPYSKSEENHSDLISLIPLAKRKVNPARSFHFEFHKRQIRLHRSKVRSQHGEEDALLAGIYL